MARIASRPISSRNTSGSSANSFGTRDGRALRVETQALEPFEFKPAVTTNSGGRRKVIKHDPAGRVRGRQGHADHHRLQWRTLDEMAADQVMPADMVALLQEHGAFTAKALRVGTGNGVPMPMGRAIASAVARAIEQKQAA